MFKVKATRIYQHRFFNAHVDERKSDKVEVTRIFDKRPMYLVFKMYLLLKTLNIVFYVTSEKQIIMASLNPHTPVAQKVADEVVLRRFQGEGVEFFKFGHH